jgi:hypothetical protein
MSRKIKNEGLGIIEELESFKLEEMDDSFWQKIYEMVEKIHGKGKESDTWTALIIPLTKEAKRLRCWGQKRLEKLIHNAGSAAVYYHLKEKEYKEPETDHEKYKKYRNIFRVVLEVRDFLTYYIENIVGLYKYKDFLSLNPEKREAVLEKAPVRIKRYYFKELEKSIDNKAKEISELRDLVREWIPLRDTLYFTLLSAS